MTRKSPESTLNRVNSTQTARATIAAERASLGSLARFPVWKGINRTLRGFGVARVPDLSWVVRFSACGQALRLTRSRVFSACSSPDAASVRPRIYPGTGPVPRRIATPMEGALSVAGGSNETVGAEALRLILKPGSFAGP